MYNMVPRGLVLKMCIGGSENYFKKKEENIKIKVINCKRYKFKCFIYI